ncbi:MAG TPA: hypothetical protein ENI27_08320 [bacterium]|nr:hypothetical protein [bacterium]
MTTKKIPTHTQQNTKPTKAHSEKEAMDLLKVLPVEGDQDQTTVKAKPGKRISQLPTANTPAILPATGQPTLLTVELTEKICAEIMRSAAFPDIVAQALGVVPSTFATWMREDLEFHKAIRRACAAIEVELSAKVMSGNRWNNAAWLLERTRAERYAPKAYMAIDARTAADMGDEELQRIVFGVIQRRGLIGGANSETGQDEPVEMVNGPDGEYQAKD